MSQASFFLPGSNEYQTPFLGLDHVDGFVWTGGNLDEVMAVIFRTCPEQARFLELSRNGTGHVLYWWGDLEERKVIPVGTWIMLLTPLYRMTNVVLINTGAHGARDSVCPDYPFKDLIWAHDRLAYRAPVYNPQGESF